MLSSFEPNLLSVCVVLAIYPSAISERPQIRYITPNSIDKGEINSRKSARKKRQTVMIFAVLIADFINFHAFLSEFV